MPYSFDKVTGAMKLGWIEYEGKKYYYSASGIAKGELAIDGKWYYFDPEEKGAMITGIHKFPNKTVYYGVDGAMKYGEQHIDGHWYYFEPVSGAMKTGLHMFPNKTVLYGEDGKMLYGTQMIEGIPYSFDKVTGAMKLGWKIYNNNKYYFIPTELSEASFLLKDIGTILII